MHMYKIIMTSLFAPSIVNGASATIEKTNFIFIRKSPSSTLFVFITFFYACLSLDNIEIFFRETIGILDASNVTYIDFTYIIILRTMLNGHTTRLASR